MICTKGCPCPRCKALPSDMNNLYCRCCTHPIPEFVHESNYESLGYVLALEAGKSQNSAASILSPCSNESVRLLGAQTLQITYHVLPTYPQFIAVVMHACSPCHTVTITTSSAHEAASLCPPHWHMHKQVHRTPELLHSSQCVVGTVGSIPVST